MGWDIGVFMPGVLGCGVPAVQTRSPGGIRSSRSLSQTCPLLEKAGFCQIYRGCSWLGACCKLVLRHESMTAPRFQEPASPGRGPSRPESGLKCPRTAAGSGLSASRLGRFAWHRPRFGAESGGAASCHVVRWSLAGSCGVTVIRGQPGPCWAGGLWKNPISERSWLLAACGWPRL